MGSLQEAVLIALLEVVVCCLPSGRLAACQIQWSFSSTVALHGDLLQRMQLGLRVSQNNVAH